MTTAVTTEFHVGQRVDVAPRTWAGINKPGGIGTITKIHLEDGCVDVKYLVMGGTDIKIDFDYCKPHAFLERGGRTRRENRVTNVVPPPKRRRRGKMEKRQEEKRLEDQNDPPPLLSDDVSAEDKVTDIPGAIEIRIGRPPKLSPLEMPRKKAASKPKSKKKKKLLAPKNGSKVTMVETVQTKKSSAEGKQPPAVRRASGVSEKKSAGNKKKVDTSTTTAPPKEAASEKKFSKSTAPKPNKKSASSDNTASLANKKAPKISATVASLVTSTKKRVELSLKPKKPVERFNYDQEKVVEFPEIYNHQVQRADEYVSGLLAEKTKKKLVVKYKMDPNRADIFKQLFSKLMYGAENGELEEVRILGDINIAVASTGKDAPFTTDEVDCALEQLTAQGKIMVCDGKVYSI